MRAIGSLRVGTLFVAGLVCCPACAEIVTGTWAGDRMTLTATSSGATITADCAGGHIMGALQTDHDGRFKADGRFDIYRPGPQQADEPATAAVVHFEGRLKGNMMSLTVITQDGSPPRTFALVRGVAVKATRCL